jgi:hypothetical protein
VEALCSFLFSFWHAFFLNLIGRERKLIANFLFSQQFDTMTDSDFFSDPGATGAESDNEQEAAMAIGDRKARVIDGTLYSTSPANSVANQPATMLMTSSAATIEDMESSGVFSDVERRPDPLPITTPCISEEPMESGDTELLVDEEKKIEGEEQETNLEVPKEMVSEAPAGVIKVPAKKAKMPARNVPSKVCKVAFKFLLALQNL